jgi:thioredoxin reductase (NADPH)
VTVRNEKTKEEETVPTLALFIYIGAQPRTDWLGDQLARDEQGYLLTGPDLVEAQRIERFQSLDREPYFLETCVPGVFAAGDTRYGSVKRIASSVGEGAMAITLIHQYMASL